MKLGLRRRLLGWPAAYWKVIGGVAGLLVGGVMAMGAYHLAGPVGRVVWTIAAGLFGAGFGAGGALILYLALRQSVQLEEAESQLRAFMNVRPLTGRLPIDLGGWAADPVLADILVRLILRKRPNRVVECGSGWSTVLMAACLRELGHGQLFALEHLEAHAANTRELLERTHGADWAEVWLDPLEDHQLAGEAWPWYAAAAVERIEGPIELLVVDGPPGDVRARCRYPAIPLLRDRLAADCTVVLDDGLREDEAWIARRWGEALGVEPRLIRLGRGIWVLELAASEGTAGPGSESGPPGP